MVNILDYLQDELQALTNEFKLMFPKYGTSWKDMTIYQLIKRMDEEQREVWSAYQAVDDDLDEYYTNIREEALDVALVALFLAESCKRLQG